MVTLRIIEVLKEDVNAVNPFIPEMPAAGNHLIPYEAMNNAFTEAGKVCITFLDDWLKLAVDVGYNEGRIRQAFEALASYGLISIEDGKIIPTKRYLQKFVKLPHRQT